MSAKAARGERNARISFTVGLFLGIAEGVFFCVLASIL